MSSDTIWAIPAGRHRTDKAARRPRRDRS